MLCFSQVPLPEVIFHSGRTFVVLPTHLAVQICGLDLVKDHLQSGVCIGLAGIIAHGLQDLCYGVVDLQQLLDLCCFRMVGPLPAGKSCSPSGSVEGPALAAGSSYPGKGVRGHSLLPPFYNLSWEYKLDPPPPTSSHQLSPEEHTPG